VPPAEAPALGIIDNQYEVPFRSTGCVTEANVGLYGPNSMGWKTISSRTGPGSPFTSECRNRLTFLGDVPSGHAT